MLPTHPVITDLRAMAKTLVPRLKDGGQQRPLDEEPEPGEGSLFEILFVRLLSPPGRTRLGGTLAALAEAAFELRIAYDPAGHLEATSTQALLDAETLLARLPDEALVPAASPIEHVRALAASIDRSQSDRWRLQVELDVFYQQG